MQEWTNHRESMSSGTTSRHTLHKQSEINTTDQIIWESAKEGTHLELLANTASLFFQVRQSLQDGLPRGRSCTHCLHFYVHVVDERMRHTVSCESYLAITQELPASGEKDRKKMRKRGEWLPNEMAQESTAKGWLSHALAQKRWSWLMFIHDYYCYVSHRFTHIFNAFPIVWSSLWNV